MFKIFNSPVFKKETGDLVFSLSTFWPLLTYLYLCFSFEHGSSSSSQSNELSHVGGNKDSGTVERPPASFTRNPMRAILGTMIAVVVAQLVERSLPTPEVLGSNPVIGKLLYRTLVYCQLF